MAPRVNLDWVSAPELSAAHAAYLVATGAPCTDQKAERLLVGAITDINNRLVTASLDMSKFWNEYFAQRLGETELDTACTSALLAAGCSELQVDQTARAVKRQLSDARQVFQEKFPKLADQLDLRARPLRDRWRTVGPGLLREVERQIWNNSPPKTWWPPRVTALMVQPFRGGAGGYAEGQATFWMEAMLTDTDPAIPEVLRIIWLMTRMSIDQHTFGKSGEPLLSLPWALASVPIVLTAGVELELIREDLPIRSAMEIWRIGDANLADILQSWWQQHQADPAPLPVALKLLQKAIDDARIVVSERAVLEPPHAPEDW